ncbi:MAG: hypothetical protein BWY47_00458 [Bacteroidetes bacterium ADurb.Bin302]|nr:MAG: hypothetical protein BWY47_00458 [Bacteroidetes bacterium ADurb.Bin302]
MSEEAVNLEEEAEAEAIMEELAVVDDFTEEAEEAENLEAEREE